MSPFVFAPWQVLVALLALIVILSAALLLAQIHVFAVAGLVPVLVAAGRLIPKLLVRGPDDEEPRR